jgi:hypothetical protein
MKPFARMIAFILPVPALSCSNKNSVQPRSHTGIRIRTGTAVELAARAVGPSGGTVTIGKSGDPLDGMESDMPADAFSAGPDP